MGFKIVSRNVRWRPFSHALGSLAIVLACTACTRATEPPPLTTQADAAPKKSGIYAVLRQGATPDEARGGDTGCVVVPYHKQYTDAGPSETMEYVAIDPSAFVPMILEGAPIAKKDEGGKTILSVTLKKEYVKPLEDFTRAHLGGKIAILVDGEVVTIHKVRSVISEGQFQVTRCTDNACEVLRAKLTK